MQAASLDRRFFSLPRRDPAERADLRLVRGGRLHGHAGRHRRGCSRRTSPQPLHRALGHEHDRHQPAPVAVHHGGAQGRRPRRRDRPGRDAYRALGRLARSAAARHGRCARARADARHRAPRACTTRTTSSATRVGFEELRERLAEYPPERVAEITGLAEDEVVELARAYATTRPAAIRTLIGMGHHERGGDDDPHDRLPAGARRRLARARRRDRRHDSVGRLAPLNLDARRAARSRGPADPRGQHGAARPRPDRSSSRRSARSSSTTPTRPRSHPTRAGCSQGCGATTSSRS